MKNKILWILTVVIFLAIFIGGTYNRLVSLSENIDASWSQVENVLQRRYDLIPNLVNTVKGYMKHEKELLEEITKLRSQWASRRATQEKMELSAQLESALSKLMIVVENYPQLKANESFLKLQDELAGTENRIAVERKRYNEAVRNYNIAVKRFPSNIIASIFGFAPKDVYFKAEEKAKEVPKVEF